MTLREKILTEFQSWDSERQLQEYQAYKQLNGFSPLNDIDYSLMEQIMNNINASIDCEDGNCEISFAPTETVIEATEIGEIKDKPKKVPEVKNAASIWDRNGAGAVPNQSDISHLGFEAIMKASTFLALADKLEDNDLSSISELYYEGGAFGFPFLGIDWYGDEKTQSEVDDLKDVRNTKSVKKNVWKVDKHEGRHRVQFFMDKFGDKEITVSMFTSRVSRELKNDDLKDYMFAKGIKLKPQSRAKDTSKSFEIADLINKSFVDFTVGKTITDKDDKDES